MQYKIPVIISLLNNIKLPISNHVDHFRMRQETKHLSKNYSTMERNSQTYYRPVNFDPANPGMTIDLVNQGNYRNQTLESWDASRGRMTSHDEQCTCATLPARQVNGEETQGIYNSIKST